MKKEFDIQKAADYEAEVLKKGYKIGVQAAKDIRKEELVSIRCQEVRDHISACQKCQNFFGLEPDKKDNKTPNEADLKFVDERNEWFQEPDGSYNRG